MTQQTWERVVAALRRLGCEVLGDGEFQVTVCRGAVKIQRIRKISPVPIRAQRRIIEALDFDEQDYLAALSAES